MEPQVTQQVEDTLRQPNAWPQIRQRLLETFAQVSTADLDAATTVDDLCGRIADKTHYSDRYVEQRLMELAGVGSGQSAQFIQQQGQQRQQSSFGVTAQQRGNQPPQGGFGQQGSQQQ